MKKLLIQSAKGFAWLILTVAVLVSVVIGWTLYRNTSTANEKWFSFLYPSFYLKVEDQNGRPVNNAKIKYTNGHNYWLGSNISYAETNTAADGLIKFYLDDRVFDINEISRDGYHIDFYQQLLYINKQDPRGRLFPSVLRKFDKNTPLVVKAWKFSGTPNHYRGSGRILLDNETVAQIGIRRNTNVHCLKKRFPCRAKLPSATISGDGDLVIRLHKIDGETDHAQSKGWSVSISVPSGGIREVDDLYLYKAPVNGYSSNWISEQTKQENGDFNQGFMGRTHKFYVSLEQGQYFGRLYIQTYPFFNKKSLIDLEYFVNADGTTNLDAPLRPLGQNSRRERVFYNYTLRDPDT